MAQLVLLHLVVPAPPASGTSAAAAGPKAGAAAVDRVSTVEVASGVVLATTSTRLTSVTIDICALKQGLDFSNELLVTLSVCCACAP